MTLTVRLLLGTLVAGMLTAVFAVVPASACGCGGVVAPTDKPVTVPDETAVVQWDGHIETIVLQLGMVTDAKDAALILPVPARATASLASPGIVDALQEISKPKVVYDHRSAPKGDGSGDGAPGAAGGATPPVTVLNRTALGPFDVALLAATDATALSNWLSQNGFQLKPAFAAAVTPYVRQRWEYVAIRLRPSGADNLQGRLTPLKVRFASDSLIYPMRLSTLATKAEQVTVYVLAAHRVERHDAATDIGSTVAFAGWVSPTDTAVRSTPLAGFLPGRQFLTKLTSTVAAHSTFADDFRFRYADADTAYQQVVHQIVYDADSSSGSGSDSGDGLTTGAWAAIGGGAVALVAIGLVTTMLARRRRT